MWESQSSMYLLLGNRAGVWFQQEIHINCTTLYRRRQWWRLFSSSWQHISATFKNLEMGIVFVKPYWEFCSVFGGHITQCIMYLSACFWRAFRKMKCPLQWAFCIVKPSAVGITETRAFVRWKNFYVYLGVLRPQKH